MSTSEIDKLRERFAIEYGASEVKRWRQWKKFDDGSIEIYPWNSSTSPDTPCFIAVEDHDRIVDKLKSREAAAYKVYQEMSATIARQARAIEKLKGMVSHYETCATVDRYDDEEVPCDCGLEKELEAIEQGEGT